MSQFVILARGRFTRETVAVHYRPVCDIRWNPTAEAFIDDTWSSYLLISRQSGLKTYNGKVLRLDSFTLENGLLSLMLSDTDYRSYVGTGTRDFVAAFPHMPQANPLSVSAALITSDAKIIIEKRSRVDGYHLRYHVIGGFMEKGPDTACSTPSPFDALAREVREETGLKIDTPSGTGLVRTVGGSELCFYYRLSLSSPEVLEIKAREKTDSEIEHVEFIDDSPRSIATFLSAHSIDLVPSGMACLLLYGREAYGDAWYHRTMGQLPSFQPAAFSLLQ
jgi:8-oxo-dGTP pyrophosphatase MutT (NUDIX family)